MQNKQNYNIQITETLSIVFDKWTVAKTYNHVSWSFKKCFLSFHLKIKFAEDLIQSDIEYRRSQGSLPGHAPQKIFCTYSHFVPWEAVSQTK